MAQERAIPLPEHSESALRAAVRRYLPFETYYCLGNADCQNRGLCPRHKALREIRELLNEG